MTAAQKDLVATSDIARRCGVSRSAVRKWWLVNEDFPEPVVVLPRGDGQALRLWEWETVDRWRAARGLGSGD